MEDGGFSPDTMLAAIDFNLMDDLLFDGFWLETTTATHQESNFWLPCPSPPSATATASASSTPPTPFYFPQPPKNNTHTSFLKQPHQPNASSHHPSDMDESEFPTSSVPPNFVVHDNANANANTNTRLWVGPDKNPVVSVRNKLVQAINHLKDSIGDKEILIQIWVPVKRGGRQVLTTNNQPFTLNSKCKNLAHYRAVSRNYQFVADEDSKQFTGLPGRVFQKKLPEWTPDVRFFKSDEYPRVNHAQQYNVRGSVALPVFEQGSGNCLGVVEIVTTSQRVNYRPELENVCKALQEFDLKSNDILSAPNIEDSNECYQAALAEIRNVLKCVCEAHELPLAQTWSPCSQQGKGGCRHSDENYARCVSTIDSACYVADEQVFGFHEACSEHHLLKGEGIAGKAFLTNQPCFAQDITAFSKTEYPLSHHARVFNLCAAVAIRLRSTYTGSTHDFVLEFFLPLNCKDGQDQKRMLESLSYVIQRTCQSLRVVMDQELAQGETSGTTLGDENYPKAMESSPNTSSWVKDMMDSQNKGKGIVSLGGQHEDEEEAEGGFRVTTQWDVCQDQQDSESKLTGQNAGKFFLDSKVMGTEKKKSKSEKTISLQVLRQYFAGSLKDAAKNIGVCPTTLKRICRQHGISRWPSRKIQKVGHSLKKLQQVMDTVQGAEGSIQLTSFYNNFPELASPNVPATGSSSGLPTSSKTSDELQQLNVHQQTLLGPPTTASKSPSSSGSSHSHSHSSSSSYCFSTGGKHSSYPVNVSSSGEALSADQAGGLLKRAQSDAELHELCQEGKNVLVRSYSHKSLINNRISNEAPPMPKSSPVQVHDTGPFRVKAAFGEEKIRFSLQPQWGFEDLQHEVLKRFNIDRGTKLDIKYLDDDSEWVLLTCDADLEECVDIHRSSKSRTVKLSLGQPSYHQRPSLGSSFGSNYGPSY